MKVTVLKEKEKKSIVYPIVMLILGIFLTFNSDGMMNLIFSILGGIILAYGIYKLIRYINFKKQFKTENQSLLLTSISYIGIGLVIILLSNILTNAINIITGIWLLYTGIDKIVHERILNNGMTTPLITGVILIVLGFYTIISKNVVFIFIGIALIIYSAIEIYNYFKG